MRFKKLIFIPITALIIALLSYLLIAYLLGAIKIKPLHQTYQDIPIYLTTNGVHTDIILPTKVADIDWLKLLDPNDALIPIQHPKYIAFGWGERKVYLETPYWKDLTIKNAINALIGNNETVLHVDYLTSLPNNQPLTQLWIDQKNYQLLSQNITQTFKRQHTQIIPIPNAHYATNDAFYLAHGRYHLFNTCNTWVNNQLKQANLPAVIWTPFSSPLMNLSSQNAP
ncbi:TIGR02117 family protein [Suttonella ornithocola]|uniref:Protein of uncharacterized function (DUF2459) n=1 Tax=Suttonella ornithocola TaxID=279832 RepID=A0A380MU51_9GAMM|nr:TIGR02117 family protein [Suttonella ornithocola]SUO95808.1 Protein of uncharacterised function (DUF2459) [Suttonella ornithocola]